MTSMITMKRGQHLHDRATRRLPITDEERVELQQWYDQMDAEEARTVRIPDGGNLEAIHRDIDATLREIGVTANQIIEIREENRAIRKQIAELQREYLRKRSVAA